jgi:ABC-type antimicrobial peptide transport system permease subunit
MSYSVSRGTAEIGLRIALGERRGRVLWRVLEKSLSLVGIGLVLGIPAALMGAHVVKAMLFGVQPMDPVSLMAVSAVICITAALAAYVPAVRASRIDPANALRHE